MPAMPWLGEASERARVGGQNNSVTKCWKTNKAHNGKFNLKELCQQPCNLHQQPNSKTYAANAPISRKYENLPIRNFQRPDRTLNNVLPKRGPKLLGEI